MFSFAKPSGPARSVPVVLTAAAAGTAALAAIPTGLIGGADALGMMVLGAGLSLLAVLGGFALAKVSLRGPDRYAVKLVVGGLMIRLALLVAAIWACARFTGLDPGRFVLWVVTFYFALVMAEAWILARHEVLEGSR